MGTKFGSIEKLLLKTSLDFLIICWEQQLLALLLTKRPMHCTPHFLCQFPLPYSFEVSLLYSSFRGLGRKHYHDILEQR